MQSLKNMCYPLCYSRSNHNTGATFRAIYRFSEYSNWILMNYWRFVVFDRSCEFPKNQHSYVNSGNYSHRNRHRNPIAQRSIIRLNTPQVHIHCVSPDWWRTKYNIKSFPASRRCFLESATYPEFSISAFQFRWPIYKIKDVFLRRKFLIRGLEPTKAESRLTT